MQWILLQLWRQQQLQQLHYPLYINGTSRIVTAREALLGALGSTSNA